MLFDRRHALVLAATALAGSCFAQSSSQAGQPTQQAPTPAILPKTPDVKLPPPLTLPPPHEAVVGQQPLSVNEAVAIALQRYPQVNIARANILIAQGNVQQAESGLYPQFSANGSFSNNFTIKGSGGGGGSSGTTTGGGGTGGTGGSGSSGGGGAANRFNASVNVNQLLFDFGRTRDQVRQQSALERASVQTLSRTQQTVALQVKQSFYTLIQNQDDLAANEGNVANRKRELDQATALVTAGTSPPSDLVQAKANLADAAVSLTQARDTLLLTQITLAQLLGIDPRTPLHPATASETPLPTETDLQALVVTAMQNRPDIKASQEQVTAAHFQVSAAQKNDLPKVSASAGVSGRGPNDPLDSQNASVGINVVWNFGDEGLTAGLVKQAKGNEMVAEQNLIQTTQQAVTDVSQAYVDLQSAQQRVTLAGVSVANALELVRISEGRYTGGLGQFLDITNAQNTLFGAQKSLNQAKQDVERARARLRTAIGLL